jgi:hypothetical protein
MSASAVFNEVQFDFLAKTKMLVVLITVLLFEINFTVVLYYSTNLFTTVNCKQKTNCKLYYSTIVARNSFISYYTEAKQVMFITTVQ